jgi:galactokinase
VAQPFAAADRAHVKRADPLFDRVLGQFETAGFEPGDAAGRARLVLEAASALAGGAGAEPRWGWFVPGRIEIFGKHTDYAGGRSLLCAVPRGFAVAARPRDDGLVRAIDARLGGTATIDPTADPSRASGWAKYVGVVASRLARDFPGAPIGVDIAFASDLPRAAGLSSSSALVVALAQAIVRRGGLDQRPEFRRELPAPTDLAGYLGAVENGLTFKTFTGAAGVGTDGGSEDHTAILLCRAGQVSAYSYLPVLNHGDAAMPRDWCFVVAASGAEADKAGAAREQYNRASRATRTLLDRWHARFGGAHRHLAAALAAQPQAISGFADGLGSGSELFRRLTHFIGEDGRVPEALEAFQHADRKRLGRLAGMSQDHAETLLGNQIPETVALAHLARVSGAFAASSFGAGFGGSVWALIDAGDAARFATAWLEAYRARFPSIAGASAFTCRPAPATVELTLDGPE